MSDPDATLASFVQRMAAAGNPGEGRHEIGMHHVHGWVLVYDPARGGHQIQAVIGTDGAIHALRGEESMRVHKVTAAEWASEHDGDSKLAERLDEILAFNGVEPRA